MPIRTTVASGRRYPYVLVAAILTLAATAAALIAVADHDRAADERRSEADRAAADLSRRLEIALGNLRTTRGLFEASQEVTAREFRSFARALLREPVVTGARFAVRLPGRERRRFERRQGISIVEPADRTFLPAGRRREYFPIVFYVSRHDDRRVRGVDAGGSPLLRKTLVQARDRGRAIATDPTQLFLENRPTGFFVYEPVYRNDMQLRTVGARRAALRGFVLGAFDPQLLGNAVRTDRRDGTRVQIFLGDRLIYGPRGRMKHVETRPVGFAGRHFTLEVESPVAASLALPGAIVGVGLALAALIVLFYGRLSERVRSRRRLAEANERFTRAFSDAAIGMALVDLDGRFVQVNRSLCRLSGYSEAELVGRSLTEMTHPDDVENDADARERLLAGEIASYEIERRYFKADGELVTVSLTVSLVRDDDGEPAHFISQVQDITERKRFEGQLQYLADHDGLTGLFNRRRFEEELNRELTVAARYRSHGAVLVLDLDNFKYFNDSLGHSAGDELIARVGALLRDCLRDIDIPARLGGDEFAAILPRADETRARIMAADLLRAIRDDLRRADRGEGRVTASAGIALFDAPDDITGEELLVEADVAMYDAKEAGRDRIATFDAAAGRHARMQASFNWADRIHRALAEDALILYAQPIVGLNGDRVPRHELLLRMHGENGDLIPPGAFLDVAERFDLIQDIDRWVVSKAIELLAEHQRGGARLCLELNLSAKSVTDTSLLTLMEHEAERTGADLSGLVVEVTETAAIVNVDSAKNFARGLNELGCGFALDDFGAGFASFYYLKHLAFDYVKIDGEFIRDLHASRTNRLVVRSVVDIARGLGKRTIAEFVGDAQTLELLRDYGVDYAQGFYLGQPQPLDALDLHAAPAVPAGHPG